MKIDIQRDGPVYTARIAGVVGASPNRVFGMLTTPEGALGFKLMKKVALWEPRQDCQDGTSVRVRYEMATVPSFDIDVDVSRSGPRVFFSSVDDTWVDMKGSWDVKPYFFGKSYIVLQNTITVHSFWLKFLPLQGIIESTVKSLFEDLDGKRFGFWKRVLKTCMCCVRHDDGHDDGPDGHDGRPSVPAEQRGSQKPSTPRNSPIPTDETSE